MTHERMEELVASYALDSIEPLERATAQEDLLDHLAGCADCRTLYGTLRATAADLALIVEPVAITPAFEDRVMGAVRGDEPTVVTPLRAPVRWLMRATTAAAVAAALALGAVSMNVSSELRQTRVALQALNDPKAAHATLRGVAGQQGAVSVALRRNGRAVVIASGLPRVAKGRVFQLWFMRGSEPVSAGIIPSDDEVTVVELGVAPDDYNAAAITIEDGPSGVSKPTSDPILAAPLKG